MKTIVGLGNPGPTYENTRHNVGFLFVDYLAEYFSFQPTEIFKRNLSIRSGIIGDFPVLICKPLTYMNLSGQGFAPFFSFKKINIDDICVVHDDLDLNFPIVKIKKNGGNAGHKGLKSLDESIGKDYMRIRIGIDRPEYKDQVSDYVLSKFTLSELKNLESAFEAIALSMKILLKGDIVKALNNIKLQHKGC